MTWARDWVETLVFPMLFYSFLYVFFREINKFLVFRKILIDNETEEGLYLRIIVEEFPVLGEIIFEGNKKKSKQTLKEEYENTTQASEVQSIQRPEGRLI